MSDADLHALWSAWFKDRTLHRGCNLVSAIMRATVERRAVEAPPAAEEPPARICAKCSLANASCSLWDCPQRPVIVTRILVPQSNIDPTGTDPYPPQVKPPQTDARGERAPLPQGGIVHAPDSPLLRAQDDWGRRRTVHLDSGPLRPTNPEDDGA